MENSNTDEKYQIKEEILSWSEFKIKVADQILIFYRGQSYSKWSLKTSYHRSPISSGGFNYWREIRFELTYFLRENLLSIERIYKRDTNQYMLSLLTFLQHHGYPTPLLDWTESPYVAAYFAFAEVKPWDIDPDKYAAIYCIPSLNPGLAKRLEVEQAENIFDEFQSNKPFVYFFRCPPISNERSIIQQSWLMATNLDNPLLHLNKQMENSNKGFSGFEETGIWRYLISHSEYADIMRDLERMNITSMTLFRGPDSICAHMRSKDERMATLGK